MKREEAQKYLASIINGTHKDCTHNHYKDAQTALDKIVEEFENEKIEELYAWACLCWRKEVEQRPKKNVFYNTLDSTWKQVINKVSESL